MVGLALVMVVVVGALPVLVGTLVAPPESAALSPAPLAVVALRWLSVEGRGLRLKGRGGRGGSTGLTSRKSRLWIAREKHGCCATCTSSKQ